MRSGFLFSIIAMFCSSVWAISGNLGNGNGSRANPYLIEDFADFQKFASTSSYWLSGVHTKLMCNVDLNPALSGRKTYTTAVIGRDTSTSYGFQGTAFAGIFDGNGYVISNLTIDTMGVNNSFLGLFGWANSSGEIKNLGVENVNIIGSTNSSNYVGGLCGDNLGFIKNCYATGSVSGTLQVGGLCGRNNEGFIDNCYANCMVTGTMDVGGLCGWNYNLGFIEDCYAAGSVSGYSYLGGLCGRNGDGGIAPGFIKTCGASADVVGRDGSSFLGGLCGINSGSISDCYSIGAIKGGRNSTKLGGLCGVDIGGFHKCYAAGSISGGSGSYYLGGLCGEINGSYITDSFWDIQTSGVTKGIGNQTVDPEGVTGKTTAQMQIQSTFIDAGWEFANFQKGLRGWYVFEGSYPQFDWQNPHARYVPDVSNRVLSEAQIALAEYGLTVGDGVYVKSWKTPVGIVAGISVHAGGYVDITVPVDIFVSSGNSGDGSQANPYEVACKTDLDAINSRLSSCYIMTADIYLGYNTHYSAAIIAPDLGLGSNYEGTPFSGFFDGNSHIISNLTMSSTDVSYSGLFGYVGPNGTVANLGIKNSNARIYNYQSFAAVLCGKN
ncbi:MAG: PASTA domain-containing protein, partial [Planctomycetales bacterium]|nr:PASTA domain-containing protein [Planctomycetales bacterium]